MVANCAARGANFRPRPRRPPRRDTRRSISSVALVAPLKARAAGRHSEQPSRRPQHVRGPIFPVAADADRPLQPRGDGGVRALAGAARRRRVRAQPLEAGHWPLSPPPPRGRAPNLARQPRPCSWRARARRAPRRLRRGARCSAAAATSRAASPSSLSATARPLRTARRSPRCEATRWRGLAALRLERALAPLRARAFRISRPAAARSRSDDGGHVCAAIVGGPRWRRRAGGAAPLEAARDRRRAAQGGLARGAGARLPQRSAILSWRGGARRAAGGAANHGGGGAGAGGAVALGAAAGGGGGRRRARASDRRAGAWRAPARGRAAARVACSRCRTRCSGARDGGGGARRAPPLAPRRRRRRRRRAAPKACAHRAAARRDAPWR